MRVLSIDYYWEQINYLNEVIADAKSKKQKVMDYVVEEMQAQGWVFINTEYCDYDAMTGLSPRLISPILAEKMGITHYIPWVESQAVIEFRANAKELIARGERPVASDNIRQEITKKSDHEQNWKKDAEQKWYKWYKESPDLNGLWTVATETRKWLEDNVIYLEGGVCEF